MGNKNILLHIGFHKTGSTFLQRYFETNPNIYFTRDFDQEIENISSDYSNVAISNMRITVGEEVYNSTNLEIKKINLDSLHKEKASQLYSLYPTAKILISIRSFESIIPSLYSQYLLNGGRLKFNQFLTNNIDQLIELYNYDKIYEIYAHFFSEENILAIPFELLKDNPKDYIHAIEDFFILPKFEFIPAKVNESLPIRLQNKIRRRNVLVFYLVSLFPSKFKKRLFRKYVNSILERKDKLIDNYKSDEPKNLKYHIPEKFIDKQRAKNVYIKRLKYIIDYAKHY